MQFHQAPRISSLILGILFPGIVLHPGIVCASLTTYDAAIATDHGDGDGPLPYASALMEALEFDTTFGEEFDFGDITDDATFEFIVEGDPDAARNGYLAVGENSGNSLRYEQWDDTGQLGFTRSGLADYLFVAEDDEDLVLSPTEPKHVTYLWKADDQIMELYIDGELAGTNDGPTFEMPTGQGFLGANPAGTEAMEGTIHRLTAYDEALSAESIQAHANAWLASDTDPAMIVPAVVELDLTGGVQSFELAISNAGENNPLSINEVNVGGTDADKFTISTALPLTIQPMSQGVLEYSFDPMGATGQISAIFEILSNDPQNDETTVQLSGVIHDPKLETEAALEFGESESTKTLPLQVKNAGATQDLVISEVKISGENADAFGATNPGTIAPGATGEIAVTFSPGDSGGYDAVLEILSNDPVQAQTDVALSATVPLAGGLLDFYDAVIAADHGDGNGPYPYEAALFEEKSFDGEEAAEFDFGEIEESATFEFIVEGDPVDGGRDGFLAVGEDPVDNLRYEQWDDTGQLGFTRLGVADNLFTEEEDPDLLLSPEVPTHVTYVWNDEDFVMQLFINGELAGFNDSAEFAMPSGLGWIGAKNDSGAEGMLGTIFRVVTYNDVLPDDVILKHALAFTEGGSLTPFAIIDFSTNLAENSATLTWTSASGASYRIERSPTLGSVGEWTEIEDGFPSQGETTSYTDPSLKETDTVLYYRVVRE